MREPDTAREARCVFCARLALAIALVVSFLPAGPLRAQPPAADEPEIRVLLAHAPEAPTVSCDGPCTLLPRGGAVEGRLLLKLDPIKATWKDGAFFLGETEYRCRTMDLAPEKGQVLSLNGKTFAGSFRFLVHENRPAVVNIVSAETYLAGVLPHEMPANWPAEALKAQAVAARTYALYYRRERARDPWDVASTVDDQVYRGGKAPAAIEKAVATTRGQALLHGEKLFPAFFHSTCGGATMKPSLALNRSGFDFIGDRPCAFCANSPHYRWRKWMSSAEVAAKLEAEGLPADVRLRAISLRPGGEQGGLLAVVEWEGGRIALPVADFRRALGRMDIKGGRFTCVAMNDGFFFYGSGLGHGAGMCQYGAAELARQGKTYTEILQYYYQETELVTLYK